MKYEYYYNNVPGDGLCRNNLIYTSLISTDKKTFVQWYHNDTEYHRGKNQVVDPELMKDKWSRELCFLTHMSRNYPELVPEIIDINLREKKIYLAIDGVDFWQRQLDKTPVPSDWQEQMLNIIRSHHELGMYKYSMHPSSYFIVNGQLKSINYFFTYDKHEGPITIDAHLSHISHGRREQIKKYTDSIGMDWSLPYGLAEMEKLCWESFRSNYPSEFVEQALACIK